MILNMAQTKRELLDENARLRQHILSAETTLEGLRRRNGQLLGVIEDNCPDMIDGLTTHTVRFNSISKVHHLVSAAIKQDIDTVSKIAKELEEDFKVELDGRKKRIITQEQIEKMQAGRRAKKNA